LRQPQALCRPRHMLAFGDRNEDAQLVQCHGGSGMTDSFNRKIRLKQ
jgi:hypothetical protein